MSDVWKVVVIDRTGGGEVHQDLTPWCDMSKSTFHPTTSPKPSPSKMYLSFPIATPNLNIREMMEVWAGFVDSLSGNWSSVWFGGFINIQRGTTQGGEHLMECDLGDYGMLLSRTRVLGWPTSEVSPPVSGYPPGHPVRDWLIGTTAEGNPYPGVLVAHLGNGVRFGGVDPIFDQIVLGPDAIPGNAKLVPGQWGFTTLQTVVDELAAVTMYAYSKHYSGGPDLRIGTWMTAVPNGVRVSPLFRMANLADLAQSPSHIFATDYNETIGELPIWNDNGAFSHERDAHEIQTIVTIKGVGGDITLISSGADPGTAPLVWAEYSDLNHQNAYPAPYQLDGGWSGAPIQEQRLHTRDLAGFLAASVERQVWGARGSIKFETDQILTPGDYVMIRDPVEGLNNVYPVRSVTMNPDPGHPRFTIQVGFEPLSLNDVLKGGLPDVLLQEQDLGFKLGTLGPGDPGIRIGGWPAPQHIDTTPSGPERNKVQPRYTDTPALDIRPGPVVRTDDNGNPITSVPVPHAIVRAANNKMGSWSNPVTGYPHPFERSMDWKSDGFKKIVIPDDVANLHILGQHGLGTPVFTINGATVVLPSAPGLLGPSALKGAYLVVTVTGAGSTPATAFSLTIGELGGF